ncbi:FeoA family protein [Leptolyngbya sp. AN02str]|uniref:FeoA family protein n=1 Tax=Leptolyngbya sp. AN02str TaxID=3423363 RepID=UPI003D316F67
MFKQGFVVSGSSLRLLRVGERGVVAKFGKIDDRIIQKLNALGITPGISITLEQRSPRFMVKVGSGRIALSEEMIRAVYVKVSSKIGSYGIRGK